MEPTRARTAAKKRTAKDGVEEHVRYEQDPRGPWYPLVRIAVRRVVEAPKPIVLVRMCEADRTAPWWPKRTVGALVAKLEADDGALVRVTYSCANVPPSAVSKTGNWTHTHVHVVRVLRADGGRGWGAWHNGLWDDGQWWHSGAPMATVVPRGGEWQALALGTSLESQVLASVG